jgi:hypothetical protein
MVRRKFPTNKLILDSCTQDNHNFYSSYIVTHRSTHLYRINLPVPQFCEFTLHVKNQILYHNMARTTLDCNICSDHQK